MCSVPECEQPVLCKDLCSMHYARLRRSGKLGNAAPLYVPDDTPLAERFWANVKTGSAEECWPWLGHIHHEGYGDLKYQARRIRAHRVAYEVTVGPIPDGLTLDHLCHTRDQTCTGGATCLHRRCVNPAHLEPVPQLENMYRGRSPHAFNALKTHCKNGHEFTPENTYWRARGRGRDCRKCTAISQRKYLARKRVG